MITIKPSAVIREILFREGICQRDHLQPWWCCRVKLPDGIGTVDNLIAIADRDDVLTDRYISDGNYVLDPHIQIVVRGVGLEDSYTKMKQITDFLDPLQDYGITIAAVPLLYDEATFNIVGTKRTTNIQFNGADQTGRRYIHTIEYDIVMT